MAGCQTRTQLSRYCVMSYRNREKKAYLILTSFWQAYLSRFRLLPNQATQRDQFWCIWTKLGSSLATERECTIHSMIRIALHGLHIMTGIVTVGICTRK